MTAGVGNTDIIVDGDLRVSGLVTFGQGDVTINDQELIELSFKNIRILKRPLIEFNNTTIYSGFKEDEILAIMKKL